MKKLNDCRRQVVSLITDNKTILSLLHGGSSSEIVAGYFYKDAESLDRLRHQIMEELGITLNVIDYILHTTPEERSELKRLSRIAALKSELQRLERQSPLQSNPQQRDE